jgi:hypothetical protein
VLSATLAAQTAAVNGTISGVVRDPSGSVIANATVNVTNLETGFRRSVTTNEAGEYEAGLLPLGSYQILVQATGFADYQQSPVQVSVGRISTVSPTLEVSRERRTVTVTADADIVQLEKFEIGRTFNETSVENNPTPSRNTQNIALLGPGLNGMRDDEFSTTQIAFGGIQRRAFMVDGVDNTQRGGQLRLGIFNIESIQEIQVVSNAMSAEYGRTVGGSINFVTKGGTNDFHGEFLYLARRPGFIARPSLYNTVPGKPFQQWATYAANGGGAIIKDRLFYFVSAEYEPLDAPTPITITPANAAALNLPASELGAAPFGQRFQTYLGRMDYRINDRNFGFVRYDFFITHSTSNSNAGGLNTRSFANNFDDRQQSIAAQWTSLVSPRAVNELRFGDELRDFFRPPVSADPNGPSIMISGVANLGTGTSANQYYLEHQTQFIDNLSYVIGRHQLKFGTDISTIHVIQEDRLALTFSFNGLSGVSPLQQYLNTINHLLDPTGKPYTYSQLTQTFGDNTADHRTQSYNVFAQDNIRIAPNFTLNLGLRYEYLQYPSLLQNVPLSSSKFINSDPNNVAPRFGFSWSPDRKTVIRGGYGLFYDTTNLRLISAVIRGTGVAVQNIVIPGTDPAAPVFPNPLASPNPAFGVKPSATVFAPDFRTLYAHQMNFQIERELMRDLSITIAYQFYGAHRLPLLRDINWGTPTTFLADGRPIYTGVPRLNPQFNQINEIESVGNSAYNGAFIAASKRFSRGLQFSASYTYGVAINNTDGTGDTGTPVSDPSSINRDKGPASADQRHRFVFEGVYRSQLNNPSQFVKNMFGGWMIAPSATVGSGFPINPMAGRDLNGDGNTNDRPLFLGRNSIEGPGFKEVNLRLSRTFALYRERVKLEIIGEAENLFNSTNPACGIASCTSAVQNVYTAPDFGRYVALAPDSVGRTLTILRLLTSAFAAALALQATPVLVLSVDGLDWRYLRDADRLGLKISNIRRIMAEGEVTHGIIGVYPTVTWPSHTSILTGVRPDQHGILGNRRPNGGDYYWTVDLLKAAPLWQKAHDRGFKTAAITWPVTVGAAIDFNLPEYFLKRNGGSMDLATIASKATPGLVEKIQAGFPSFPRQWVDDRARTQAVLYLLKNERPALLLVHLVDLDSEAHDEGPFTPAANATLEYIDELIGQMLAALPPDYVFALTSDHGFERVDRALDLKSMNPPGELQTAEFLAITKDPAVSDWLRHQNGVGRQIPQQEVRLYAPSLAGSFVFESAEHVVFDSKIRETGTHGYFPTRADYRSVFILRGPGISARKVAEASMLTIASRLQQVLFGTATPVQ